MAEQRTILQIFTDEATFYRDTGSSFAVAASSQQYDTAVRAARAAEAAKYFAIAERFETLAGIEQDRINEEQADAEELEARRIAEEES